MKQILRIIIFLAGSCIYSNTIDICTLSDPNGNNFYLSQNVNEVRKMLGSPDRIEVLEYSDRNKKELDTILWIYDWGIMFEFFVTNNKIINIDFTSPLIKTSIGNISTNSNSVDDVYEKIDARIFKDEYNDTKYLYIHGTGEDDILGPDFILYFEYLSEYSHTTISRISLYYRFSY